MPLSDIEKLRRSNLVTRIISVQFDGVGEVYALKVRVELRNGLLMQVWEHKTPALRRYAYHVYKGNRTIVRWDNSPHYPQIRTFPHHVHKRTRILQSHEMNVEEVLSELEKMI